MPRGRRGTWDHPRVCGEHIVLLILLSPFVLFMLGLVLAIVRLGDFLTDDD